MIGAFIVLVLTIYTVDCYAGRFASVLLVTWLFWFWLAVKAAKMFRRPVRRAR